MVLFFSADQDPSDFLGSQNRSSKKYTHERQLNFNNWKHFVEKDCEQYNKVLQFSSFSVWSSVLKIFVGSKRPPRVSILTFLTASIIMFTLFFHFSFFHQLSLNLDALCTLNIFINWDSLNNMAGVQIIKLILQEPNYIYCINDHKVIHALSSIDGLHKMYCISYIKTSRQFKVIIKTNGEVNLTTNEKDPLVYVSI